LDQIDMPQTINLGSLQLKFLQSKEDTAGSLDMFEMTLQPNARMPIPHYHDRWDETIYGLTGTTCWRIDGKDIDLEPGETVFIKRGVVHGFHKPLNRTGNLPVHPQPGRAWPSIFQGHGRAAVGRRT
jgi:quercetin dioxygenase-like cupin family protein